MPNRHVLIDEFYGGVNPQELKAIAEERAECRSGSGKVVEQPPLRVLERRRKAEATKAAEVVKKLGPCWHGDVETGFPARIKAMREDGESLWYLPEDETQRSLDCKDDYIDSLKERCADLFHDLKRLFDQEQEHDPELAQRMKRYEECLYDECIIDVW